MEHKMTLIYREVSETGEIIDRPFTAAETLESENAREATLQKLAVLQARETARAALLVRLGITADEAKLLLGQ
jgi:hypothetical protein